MDKPIYLINPNDQRPMPTLALECTIKHWLAALCIQTGEEEALQAINNLRLTDSYDLEITNVGREENNILRAQLHTLILALKVIAKHQP